MCFFKRVRHSDTRHSDSSTVTVPKRKGHSNTSTLQRHLAVAPCSGTSNQTLKRKRATLLILEVNTPIDSLSQEKSACWSLWSPKTKCQSSHFATTIRRYPTHSAEVLLDFPGSCPERRIFWDHEPTRIDSTWFNHGDRMVYNMHSGISPVQMAINAIHEGFDENNDHDADATEGRGMQYFRIALCLIASRHGTRQI